MLKLALLKCQEDLIVMMSHHNCQPLMLRLAWSDAMTYDVCSVSIKGWPHCGGCQGSIRFDRELDITRVNAGLSKAFVYLQPVKDKNKLVSWADLIQMAGALAVQLTGGPHIA